MPGEDMGDALRAAGALQEQGIPSILTHLGENLTDLGQAEEVAATTTSSSIGPSVVGSTPTCRPS